MVNQLLKKFIKFSLTKTAIVIEISGDTFTLVEVKGSLHYAELQRYLVCKIPGNGVTAEWLRQIWEKEQITEERVISILPNRIVKYKTTTLPVLPDNQLENALRMELDGSGEAIVRVLSRVEQDGMLTVKAALVKNKDLTAWLTPFQEAGLNVIWSGYHARGIQNYINFHQGFLQERTQEAVYLTFYDHRAEFGVVSEEAIIYRRDLKLGTDDFPDSVNLVTENDLKEELRLSAAAYQASCGKEPPPLLWVFGKDRAALKRIKTGLKRAGYQVNISFRSRLSGVVPGEDTPGIASLLGLALDELGWDVCEALRVYTMAQREKQGLTTRLNVLGKFVIAAGILVAGLIMVLQARSVKEAKSAQWLASQSGKLQELRRVEAETNAYLVKIKAMEKWLDSRGRELEFILTLQEGLPEDTLITDLTMEDGVIRNLAGTTPSVSVLLSYLQHKPTLRSLKLKGNIAVTELGLERFQLEGATKVKETK
jgi:Tfp pilus assembly protein PilN